MFFCWGRQRGRQFNIKIWEFKVCHIEVTLCLTKLPFLIGSSLKGITKQNKIFEMLFPIVTLLCLTALANLLLVINFFPVPSQPSNNEMSMLLSYSGPLASWQLLFFPTYACDCVVLWNGCMFTEGCSLPERHMQTSHPYATNPWLSIPGVLMPGSQGISSLLPLSRPFPHLIPPHSSLPDLLGFHTKIYVNAQVHTWVQASKAIATFLCAVYDPIGLFVLLCEHKFTRNSNTSNLLNDDRSPKTKCLLPWILAQPGPGLYVCMFVIVCLSRSHVALWLHHQEYSQALGQTIVFGHNKTPTALHKHQHCWELQQPSRPTYSLPHMAQHTYNTIQNVWADPRVCTRALWTLSGRPMICLPWRRRC